MSDSFSPDGGESLPCRFERAELRARKELADTSELLTATAQKLHDADREIVRLTRLEQQWLEKQTQWGNDFRAAQVLRSFPAACSLAACMLPAHRPLAWLCSPPPVKATSTRCLCGLSRRCARCAGRRRRCR